MRIVSLLPAGTDVIAELGRLDALVGVSEDCGWPPEVAALPVLARTRVELAGRSSAEIDRLVRSGARAGHSLYLLDGSRLAELEPDLVVSQELCAVCAVSGTDLEAAGPLDVETLVLDAHRLEEIAANVALLAARLGVPERGAALAGRMRAEIAAVSAAVAGGARRRVFLAEWIDPPYGPGHWLAEMVEAAGGTALLGRPGLDSVATTWEAVLDEEPELVVIAACGLRFEDALSQARGLQLPVRTVVVDGDSFYVRPSPRVAHGVRQLGHLIHPELVADPGLPAAELERPPEGR